MPIRIPDHLPAEKTLRDEGVMVMTEGDAIRQDIRPLKIVLLNLMPNKVRTETQIARLVGATPIQVEMTLMKVSSHISKNASPEHMLQFYKSYDELREQKFDGLIITGAPVEMLDFKDVDYWAELTEIFDWTQTNVHSTFNICWGAQAAINHFHKVPKYSLDKKAFGVFRHKNLNPASPYLRGFSDDFGIPVSRWTEIRRADLPTDRDLELLMEAEETGPCFIHDPLKRHLYMFNHIEYDSSSLAEEYFRDVANDEPIEMPRNYFPNDDPQNSPENRWRSHAHLLFGNWINELYQTTPFELQQIGTPV